MVDSKENYRFDLEVKGLNLYWADYNDSHTTVVFLQFHLCWNFSSLIWWISVLVYFVIDWHHIQMKCPLLFSVLDDKAGNLRFQSEKYKKDATYLNLRSAYAKYAAVGTIFVVLLIYVRFWWFWGIIDLFHDK